MSSLVAGLSSFSSNAPGSGGGGGGTPGGANTQVQFNNAGVFGGDAGFTYNAATNQATIGEAANTVPALTLLGGATGTSILSLQRTTGATITYEFSLAGGGLAMRDVTAGDFITANFFGDLTQNQLFIGQRGKTAAEATPRPSMVAGTSFSGLTDQGAAALRLIPGLGTGNATPANVEFWGHIAANGASGTTAQTAARLGSIGRGVAANFAALWLGDNASTTNYAILQGNATSGDTNTYINGSSGVSFRQNNTQTGTLRTGGLALGSSGLGATHGVTVENSLKATALAVYNTADQTTNYERLAINCVSNVFNVTTEVGGTGTGRTMAFGLLGNQMMQLRESLPFFQVNPNSTPGTTAAIVQFNSGTSGTAASGTQIFMQNAPTVNQSGTAGYTAFDVNVTETATGSGAKKLIDTRVGGVTNFSILNNGRIQYISGNTATTVGAAGGASSLPLTPTGYLLIDIGGTAFKVPYYAN